MFMTWFMLSCIYQYLGIGQKANIRNVGSHVVKDYVESKKRQPEYPFELILLS